MLIFAYKGEGGGQKLTKICLCNIEQPLIENENSRYQKLSTKKLLVRQLFKTVQILTP